MPGAGWKRKGQMYRANMDQMSALPHQFVKDQMVRVASPPRVRVSSVKFADTNTISADVVAIAVLSPGRWHGTP